MSINPIIISGIKRGLNFSRNENEDPIYNHLLSLMRFKDPLPSKYGRPFKAVGRRGKRPNWMPRRLWSNKGRNPRPKRNRKGKH